MLFLENNQIITSPLVGYLPRTACLFMTIMDSAENCLELSGILFRPNDKKVIHKNNKIYLKHAPDVIVY